MTTPLLAALLSLGMGGAASEKPPSAPKVYTPRFLLPTTMGNAMYWPRNRKHRRSGFTKAGYVKFPRRTA